MPYALRNAEGRVIALTDEPGTGSEQLPLDHPDVLPYLLQRAGMAGGQDSVDLLIEDLKLIRAIEDIIDLLIAKQVIIFSDLPPAVQQKILKKRGYREKLFGSGGDLIGSEEGIL